MKIDDIIDPFVVSDALRAYLPKGRKRSPKGWESFNCVMCQQYGEPSPDRHRKGNVIFDGPSCTIRCWRCKFKASYRPGVNISSSMASLFDALGISDDEIRELKLHIMELKQFVSSDAYDGEIAQFAEREDFQRIELPKGAKSLQQSAEGGGFIDNEDFTKAILYADSLGERVLQSPLYYTSEVTAQEMNHRIIFPFFYKKKIVGYTARYYDRAVPDNVTKYVTQLPDHYLFNNAYLDDWSRKYVVLVEGCADAIPINGVAYLKDTLTKGQINWINNSGKEVILVPDRGESAGAAVQQAIANGWFVSMPPDWSKDIKDVHDAYMEYGALYTLERILTDKIHGEIAINMRWKQWK